MSANRRNSTEIEINKIIPLMEYAFSPDCQDVLLRASVAYQLIEDLDADAASIQVITDEAAKSIELSTLPPGFYLRIILDPNNQLKNFHVYAVQKTNDGKVWIHENHDINNQHWEKHHSPHLHSQLVAYQLQGSVKRHHKEGTELIPQLCRAYTKNKLGEDGLIREGQKQPKIVSEDENRISRTISTPQFTSKSAIFPPHDNAYKKLVTNNLFNSSTKLTTNTTKSISQPLSQTSSKKTSEEKTHLNAEKYAQDKIFGVSEFALKLQTARDKISEEISNLEKDMIITPTAKLNKKRNLIKQFNQLQKSIDNAQGEFEELYLSLQRGEGKIESIEIQEIKGKCTKNIDIIFSNLQIDSPFKSSYPTNS